MLLPNTSLNIDIKNKANAIYKSPVSDLGGKNTINSEMYMNDFGNALVVNYRNIFDPQTEDDRIEIVKNAYVHSQRREQHIEPIYKEIKKIKHPSLRDTALISTNNPTELVEKVQNIVRKKEQQYPLILLIGKRGSGKTTFVRYFKNEIIDYKLPLEENFERKLIVLKKTDKTPAKFPRKAGMAKSNPL